MEFQVGQCFRWNGDSNPVFRVAAIDDSRIYIKNQNNSSHSLTTINGNPYHWYTSIDKFSASFQAGELIFIPMIGDQFKGCSIKNPHLVIVYRGWLNQELCFGYEDLDYSRSTWPISLDDLNRRLRGGQYTFFKAASYSVSTETGEHILKSTELTKVSRETEETIYKNMLLHDAKRSVEKAKEKAVLARQLPMPLSITSLSFGMFPVKGK